MRYVLAISGGVDSMVLLHYMLTMIKKRQNLIVAHVNHGIRLEADDDARFVKKTAENFGLTYRQIDLNLGTGASEEVARRYRYDFLFDLADEYQAQILTAHHLDDLVETVVINLQRGTGIRGLAVLSRKGVKRPLLNFTKDEIYRYAIDNSLEWVEDATNRQTIYLRNRVRFKTHSLSKPQKLSIASLRQKQLRLIEKIEEQAGLFIDGRKIERHPFIMATEIEGVEMLRQAIKRQGLNPPTRPILQKGLLAIKTYKPGKQIELSGQIKLVFTASFFIVTTSIK